MVEVIKRWKLEAGEAGKLTKEKAEDLIEAVRKKTLDTDELLRLVKSASSIVKYNEIRTFTAEEVNQWFIDKYGSNYNPPYKPGTIVREIELTETTAFVRVYNKKPDGSGMQGPWIMAAEDIEGLTPVQIRNKYALPQIPQYICDVELETGSHIRVGEANSVAGWGEGGGIQYDLIGQEIGNFKNERLIGGN